MTQAPRRTETDNITLTLVGAFSEKEKMLVPFLTSPIPAGFPSPADDFVEQKLDLNELIIKHPAATFFVRAQGSSMERAGIFTGDILVVDRALPVKNEAIVVAVVDGEFTVKRFRHENDRYYLIPENDAYDPIELSEEMNVSVWGVVTHVIHSV